LFEAVTAGGVTISEQCPGDKNISSKNNNPPNSEFLSGWANTLKQQKNRIFKCLK